MCTWLQNNNDNLFHRLGLSLSLFFSCVNDESPQYGCHLVPFFNVDIGDHRSIFLHLLNNAITKSQVSMFHHRLAILFKEQIFTSSNKQKNFDQQIRSFLYFMTISIFFSSFVYLDFTSSIWNSSYLSIIHIQRKKYVNKFYRW